MLLVVVLVRTLFGSYSLLLFCLVCTLVCGWGSKNGGLKIVKNGPRVWAFCKIEFPAIQKPVQILDQKSGFFRNPGNRGVGVIWLVVGCVFSFLIFAWLLLGCGLVVTWFDVHLFVWVLGLDFVFGVGLTSGVGFTGNRRIFIRI